jgi:hypothetical protein
MPDKIRIISLLRIQYPETSIQHQINKGFTRCHNVSEILQLLENTCFFNAICLCHQNGRMEEWNAGILGVKAETNHFNCKKLLQTHHSITPSFYYSNWGEAPKF